MPTRMTRPIGNEESPNANRVDTSVDGIAHELRVPFLPRSRPLNTTCLGATRWLMRATGWLAARNLPRPARPVQRERRTIGTADGLARIELRLHRPSGLPTPSPALLWIHGGGYVMGTARIDDRLCACYAERAGALVLAVDYRLAPEHPYPTPLEDCYRTLQWLHEHASELGVDPERIAVGGASAGGGLAAALALLVRDRASPGLSFQLLNYPMLDDRTVSPVEAHQGQWVWGAQSNRSGWAAYLGSTSANEALVPARATNLAGLPPAWVGCGTLDLFHPENERYARRLQASGVPCEWVSVPGAYHGFDTAAPRASSSETYFNSQIRALHACWGTEFPIQPKLSQELQEFDS